MVNCNDNYPFPVLRPEPIDYKKSIFNPKVIVTSENAGYRFHTSVIINNDAIKTLVKDKKATIGINIQCNSTWLRKIEPIPEGEYEFFLSTSYVHNRVQFCPVITANDEIDNFTSPDFMEEYNSVRVIIHPGDPLAIGTTMYFDAIYKDDILRKGDPIISITTSPDSKDMSFDFENHTILVYVPEKIQQAYSKMQATKEKYSVLSMLFYLPAITEGIRLLANDEDRYSSYKWGLTLKQSMLKIVNQNQDEYKNLKEKPFQTAQKLLNGMDKAIMDLESWSITVV